MRLAAVILAAGAGHRMGGPKALLELRGAPLLRHVLALYQPPAIALRVVVLGCEAARARGLGSPTDTGVTWVVNERWEQGGMLSSVLCGLDAAESARADAILLHPVDHPFVEPATIDALGAALGAGAPLAVPVHGGRRGHPTAFARAMFAALRAAPAEVGARAVLRGPGVVVVEVEAGPGCRLGLDTQDDLARFRNSGV